METVKISPTEIKILKAIKKYPYANIGYQELNGYLRFPPAEEIFNALGSLVSDGLIEKMENPLYGYKLTGKGEKYLSSIKFSIRTTLPSKKQVVWAVISAAISAIITGLLKS